MSFWNRKTLMLVTGASRGIGKHIAIELSSLLAIDSVVILMARSTSSLQETKLEILQKNPNIRVEYHSVDLSNPEEEEYRKILSTYSGQYLLNLLIHNAGDIICNVAASNMSSVKTWREYMALHLYSAAALTSVFLQLFSNVGEVCIVNITSQVAVEPTKHLGYHCVAKCSRDMYFKVLLEENPNLNILNYAPGIVNTDGLKTVLEYCTDPQTKTTYENMLRNDEVVPVERTVKTLVNVLGNRLYKSGDRVYYYDVAERCALQNH